MSDVIRVIAGRGRLTAVDQGCLLNLGKEKRKYHCSLSICLRGESVMWVQMEDIYL